MVKITSLILLSLLIPCTEEAESRKLSSLWIRWFPFIKYWAGGRGKVGMSKTLKVAFG